MRQSRRALTLVEVVAALVILGIILALLIKAAGQSNHQRLTAEQRLFAARETDLLISTWMEKKTPIEGGLSGEIEGPPRLYWDTLEIPDAQANRWDAKIVRVRMFIAPALPQPQSMAIDMARPDSAASPMVSVDLLTSDAQEHKQEQRATTQQSPTTQQAADDIREDQRLLDPPPVLHRVMPQSSGSSPL
jgi:prepilin-type N-terminal cleavage/methylation domain-containing protein